MYQRLLISMTITVAFSLALLAQTASAKPVPAQTPYLSEGRSMVVPQTTSSEKPASMSSAEYRALLIRSEAFNRKYGVAHHALASRGQSPKPIVSEKIGGLQLPAASTTTTQVASSGSEFDWTDAGIGAGVVFGTMLLGAGLVLTVRRRDFPIAH
jgi:hypothetical protein